MQCALMMAFAPAAVVAEETVGLQASTFLGALAGSTALLASSFVPSVNFLFVTYSFVTGVAYAFVYVPSLVILGHYFDGMLGLVAGFVQVGGPRAVGFVVQGGRSRGEVYASQGPDTYQATPYDNAVCLMFF